MLRNLIAKLDELLRAPKSNATSQAVESSALRELDVLVLEERILYSAVPIAEPPDAPANTEVDFEAINIQGYGATPAGAETPDAQGSSNASNPSADANDSLSDAGNTWPPPPWDGGGDDAVDVSRELMFIDTSVQDFHKLLDDIVSQGDPKRQIEVVFVDPTRDGIKQISEALAGRAEIDVIHIVSHGSEGRVQLGNSVLDNDSLGRYSGEIAGWASSLTAEADLLFYSCDLAGSQIGRELIESIATLTDADVAASDDLSGHGSLGGDWSFEFTVGAIETNVAVSDQFQHSWIHVLSPNDEPTFHSGPGYAVLPLANDQVETKSAIQTDGKIVAVSQSFNGANNDLLLTRFNADGSIDTSFGSGGFVVLDNSNGNDVANAIVVQPDGKIVIGGVANVSGSNQLMAARFNSDGSLDTSFAASGIFLYDIPGSADTINAIQVTDNGQILLAGTVQPAGNRDYVLLRLNSDGSLDTSLGGTGIVQTNIQAGDLCHTVTVQPDGKILLAGISNNGGDRQWSVVRYNADGSLDTTFATGGKFALSIAPGEDRARGIAVLSDGKILLGGGITNTDLNFAVMRLTSNGVLDTTFGSGGYQSYDLGGNDTVHSITVLSDGKIILVGNSLIGSNSDAVAMRLNADGTNDNTFGTAGVTRINLGTYDYLYSVNRQVDGKLVLSGSTDVNGNQDTLFIRLTSDGQLDSQFATSNSLGGSVSHTEGGFAVHLDTDATIFDAELSAANNFNGATLTLARNGGANSQDALGFDGINVSTSASNVIVSGVTVGTFSFSGGEMTITFNANATQARVNTLMRNIVYWNTSDAPPASVLIDWTFNDANTGSQGTGGALAATGSTTVNITATNDAPVLDNTGAMTMSAITEDQTNNAGQTLASIIASAGGDRITDVDSGAIKGIAITSLNSGNGTWQYSLNGGVNWHNVGVVSESTALLLRSTDLIRFVPDTTSGTAADFTFRAWDQATGLAGAKADVTTHGGTTAFSAASETAAITVTDVNDVPTFYSGPGYSVIPLVNDQIETKSAIQTDGKIVAVSKSYNGSDNDVLLTRYNTEGSIDTSFGIGGSVVLDIANGDNFANAIAVQPDGKIIIGGANVSGSNQLMAARFNSDGSIDTSFAAGGVFSYSLTGFNDTIDAIHVTDNGQILLTGCIQSTRDYVLLRLNSDGSLDTTLAGTGYVQTHIQNGDRGHTLTVQPDGKILVAGISDISGDPQGSVVRYNVDGSLDTTFGTGGTFAISVAPGEERIQGISVLSDGKILLAGRMNNADLDFAVLRLTSNGVLDTSFGTGGYQAFDLGGSDFARSMTVLPDGKIILVGDSLIGGDSDSVALRLNADGTIDNTFGTGGVTRINLGTNDYLYSVNRQIDGKLVLSGSTDVNGSQDTLLIRLTSDGLLDSQFATSNSLGGSVSYTEGGLAVHLDINATIFDAELSAANNFNGATLTLARNGGANSQDALGFDGINVSTIASNVIVSGVTVGTFSFSGGEMTITFNANATQARVNTLMRNIVYWNTSDAPPASVQIDWTFNDANTGSQGTGGALAATGSTTVNITATNDAPVASDIEGTALAYTENAGAVAITSSIGFTDVDDTNIESAVVAITGNYVSSEDFLSFTNQNGITGSYNSSTGTWTLTGSASLAQYEAAIRSITYTNSSEHPDTTTRTISFAVNDGDANSNTLTRDITITRVNDAPIAVADTATAVEAGGTANGTAGTNPTGNVLSNDTDVDSGDTKTVTGVSAGIQPSGASPISTPVAGTYGSIIIAADGSYTYTVDNNNATVQALNVGQTLQDTFTYTMQDSGGLASTTQITITIEGANDTPLAIDNSSEMLVGETIKNDAANGLLANDSDFENDMLTALLLDGPSSGALTLRSDGSWSYEAAPGFIGQVWFTYAANDGRANSPAATVTILVVGGPAPTTATPMPPPNPTPVTELKPDVEPDSKPVTPAPELIPDLAVEISAVVSENSKNGPLSGNAPWKDADLLYGMGAFGISERQLPSLKNLRTTVLPSMIWNSNSQRLLVSTDYSEELGRLNVVIDNNDLKFNLSQFQTSEEHRQSTLRLTNGAVTTLFVGATAGIATWCVGGSYLLSLIASSFPTWAGFDVIHIVNNPTRFQKEEDKSVAQIIDAGMRSESDIRL